MSSGHSHHLHGSRPSFGRAFAIATLLNLAFVVAEFSWGVIAQSVALIADAAHNLSDAAGLALAWLAAVLSRRPPTSRRTFGFGKATILAALANAILLILMVAAVGWEAVQRLRAPPDIDATAVIAVASLGVIINTISAALFARGRSDINIRGAFLHLAADALVSVGVVATGVTMYLGGPRWLDPAASLLVSAMILWSTWSLLRESLDLALDAVPEHIDADQVRAHLRRASGVRDVHNMHIWAMSAQEVALTVHLAVDNVAEAAGLIEVLSTELRERFDICHCTIQIEPVPADEDPPRQPDPAPS